MKIQIIPKLPVLTQHNAFGFSLFKNRHWAAVFILRLGEPATESIQNNQQ